MDILQLYFKLIPNNLMTMTLHSTIHLYLGMIKYNWINGMIKKKWCAELFFIDLSIPM